MADGTTKEIQNIQIGDQVVSYDLSTGKTTTDTVKTLYVHPDAPGGYVVINDTLKATPFHRVWSENRSAWVYASDLSVGDTLIGPDGSTVTVFSLTSIEGENNVYNLGLPGENHNFFTEGVLVHNWKA
jgi:intein/homing endonuclease